MEIFVRESCSVCGGGGIVTHPLWEAYHEDDKAFVKLNGRHMDCGEAAIWFEDKGRDMSKTPEEINCRECNGEGVITRWVSLDKLLPLIKSTNHEDTKRGDGASANG